MIVIKEYVKITINSHLAFNKRGRSLYVYKVCIDYANRSAIIPEYQSRSALAVPFERYLPDAALGT